MTAGNSMPAEANVAEEVPVAFVYSGRPHGVMMCTPSDLEDLAMGFSITERIIDRGSDIRSARAESHRKGIELVIEVGPEVMDRTSERTRVIAGRTGCGLCGVEMIDEAVRPARTVSSRLTVAPEALWRAGEALESRQPLNAETRAVHAAGWASASGDLEVVREDVGRHNAVDKVIGAIVRAGRSFDDGFLVVTSRASFELVQKAAAVGIPILAAVSRPTALAIRIAEESNLTLIGLLRGQSANVYSHSHRVQHPASR